jgi:hypothetical protein
MRARAVCLISVLGGAALSDCKAATSYADARGSLAAEERQALDGVLGRAGVDPRTLVVETDLYDVFWRGAAAHASLHGRSDRVASIERATPDLRNAVAIEGGHVTALRMAGANLDDLELVAPLTHLVVLDLHDEKIERIDGLDAMAELDHLDLSGNRIAAIERVSALHSLRSLYVADNRLQRLDALAGLTSLEVVNASGNAIAEISGLTNVPALRALSMERNPIVRIAGLEGAPGLTDLDLSFCQIERLENLGTMPKLLYLNLWHNHVRTLAGAEDAKRLIYLGLGDNQSGYGDPESLQIRDRFCPLRFCVFM